VDIDFKSNRYFKKIILPITFNKMHEEKGFKDNPRSGFIIGGL
jgi:hypothetical protein